ncbi:MAG: hypothetical protein AAF645_15030, partial [Myxococcota bacterium]
MNRPQTSWLLVLSLALGGAACGTAAPAGGGETQGGESADGVVLAEDGALEAGDLQMGQAFSDHFEIEVEAGVALSIDVSSTEFDPLLEVTAPAAAP